MVEDLHEYISLLEEHNKLVRVRTEVNAELEIAEILRRAVSMKLGKALLFERVKGFSIHVLGNAFASHEQVCLALGVKDYAEIGEKFRKLFELEPPRGILEAVKAIPRLKELTDVAPKRVKSGPVKEVVDTNDPSFEDFPILKVWPKDGGKFITFPLVITKNVDTGKTNIGIYRMQIFGKREATIHWQLHRPSNFAYKEAEKRGEPLEVAVVIGADPATIFAGVAPVPEGIDEYLFAGFIKGKGVELVKCETVDLEVPARAEIVLEGVVKPGEYRLEGPFGDHTGYYTPKEPYPVFELKCVTRRSDAVYLTTVVGKPVQEDAFLAEAAQEVFSYPLKLLFPEIVDLYLPPEGVFTNLAIVSIRKRFPGHAKKVMMGLWGMPQLMFLKTIIVVDDDVNIRNLSEVIWATLTRFDPARDIVVIPNVVTDTLDHASSLPNFGSKLGIDATKKWKEEGYQREWPEVVEVDEQTKKLVDEKWKSYFGS